MPYKDPEQQKRAKRASEARSRAARVKSEIEALQAPDLPDPPTDDELVRLLGVKARQGNVPAIKLLLERPWEKKTDGDSDSTQKDPLAGIDELAARRRA